MDDSSAEDRYRSAWDAWRHTSDNQQRLVLEQQMDDLQPLIAFGPKDHRWISFAASLEDYNQYWDTALEQMLSRIKGEKCGQSEASQTTATA